jgi:hypothetical protein
MFKNEIKFYKIPDTVKNVFKILRVTDIGIEIELLLIRFIEGTKYPIQIWQAPTYDFGRIPKKPDGMKLHDTLDRLISNSYSEDTKIENLEEYFDFLNKFMLEIDNFNLKEMQVELQYMSHLDLYKLYRTSPEKYKVMKDLEQALGV